MGILQGLIAQSRSPQGILGKAMLNIMNRAHRGLTLWGIGQLIPGERALDVSCGGGNAIKLMAKKQLFSHIWGIDTAKDAISLSRKTNAQLIKNGTVHLRQASVLNLPFADNYFDAVTTVQSHYHWPQVLVAVKEIHRTLRPGGRFVLVAENYKIAYHMGEYNSAALTQTLLQDGGFAQVKLLCTQNCVCAVGVK